MNKKHTILLWFLGALAFVLIGALVTIVGCLFLLQKHNWGIFDISVGLGSIGSYWETQDGVLAFQTETEFVVETTVDSYGNKFEIGGYDTTGTLQTFSGEIPITVYVSAEAPEIYIYLDIEPSSGEKHIEIWEGIDAVETDTQIIIELKVKETTYFEVGQRFRLVHNKS